MLGLRLRRTLLFNFLFCCLPWVVACAQMLTIPTATGRFGDSSVLSAMQASQMDFSLFQLGTRNPDSTPIQSPSGSVSNLDLKASGKARREYQQGYRLLMLRDLQGAVKHLTESTAIYPQFVAAHNALGSAYLSLGRNEEARSEFARAVELDDHLPNSHLNLGCAELALKQYPAAEESLRKATSIAPLDNQLQIALAYGEFVNHDYNAVLATTTRVHERKHAGAAIVHYFAAGAWEAQDKLGEAQREMETLLREEPKGALSEQFREILDQMKAEQVSRAEAKLHPAQEVTFSFSAAAGPTSEEASQQARKLLQDIKEKNQIAKAEAQPDLPCVECGETAAVESAVASSTNSKLKKPGDSFLGATLRASVDEVAIFFAATDHGKSVMNLAASDIEVRDDSQAPRAILEFRNESQLPLRLGLIIDTSNSVTRRFSFEQAAAIKFLQEMVVDKDDLAFVVGVNNSVLLVQDFTADQELTARAVKQLAPGGGTALWDAVAFGAEKLASRPEGQPVARTLVVISDGESNSGSSTLKQAIARAQLGGVAIYTVSTSDVLEKRPDALVGNHALRTLAEFTGGAAFMPGSVKHLDASLAGLQQIIRGRYMVTYKPASFKRDGRYRAIAIEAQKDGHKLKVFARRGYYASSATPASADR